MGQVHRRARTLRRYHQLYRVATRRGHGPILCPHWHGDGGGCHGHGRGCHGDRGGCHDSGPGGDDIGVAGWRVRGRVRRLILDEGVGGAEGVTKTPVAMVTAP